jgi:hypothetical protein
MHGRVGIFIFRRKTMPQVKVIRIANPHKRFSKVSRKRRPSMRKKSNPGLLGGVLTIMSNPRKRKSKKRNPVGVVKVSRKTGSRRRNPITTKIKRRGHSRRSNPFSVAGNGPSQLLKIGLGAGAGAVGTRGLTQLVLRTKNEGIPGYVANAVVAVVLGFAGGKFLGQDVGQAMLAGGLAGTVQRIWDDKVSKIAPAVIAAAVGAPAGAAVTVKGLGDISYSDDGLGRAVALGGYEKASYPWVTDNGPFGGDAIPALPPAASVAPVHENQW